MTGIHGARPASRSSRVTARPPARGGGRAVTVVDGVQMSCQELDDDFALIRFVCPPQRKRRGRPRET
jgi:hypothetical protein